MASIRSRIGVDMNTRGIICFALLMLGIVTMNESLLIASGVYAIAEELELHRKYRKGD